MCCLCVLFILVLCVCDVCVCFFVVRLLVLRGVSVLLCCDTVFVSFLGSLLNYWLCLGMTYL